MMIMQVASDEGDAGGSVLVLKWQQKPAVHAQRKQQRGCQCWAYLGFVYHKIKGAKAVFLPKRLCVCATIKPEILTPYF